MNDDALFGSVKNTSASTSGTQLTPRSAQPRRSPSYDVPRTTAQGNLDGDSGIGMVMIRESLCGEEDCNGESFARKMAEMYKMCSDEAMELREWFFDE